MDYNMHCCPVCEKQFEKGDDVVVCPICGAPHHRECYEQEMHCHYIDRHRDGFDYKAEFETKNSTPSSDESHSSENTKCKYCGRENPADSKFCNSCGMPLSSQNSSYTPYDRHSQEQGAPYSPPKEDENRSNRESEEQPTFATFAFDPMGGIKPEQEVAEGVTAGETAKFVKTSTPFYTRLFYQIKKFGRSRFSFVGFIFSGGWMLYRKMYKKGAIVTALMALMIIAQLYVSVFYSSMLTELEEIVYQSNSMFATTETMAEMEEYFAGFDIEDTIAFATYYVTTIGQLALRIICGVCGNRWYYKHCTQKIKDIKNKAETKEAADAQLQTKGGVNMALAISLAISYLLLSFLPYLFIR